MHRTLKKLNIRLLVLAAALMLTLLSAPAALAAESGSCGADLDWTLEEGTLTISGRGDMTDFTESAMAPWYPHREEIVRISLPNGLTSIGNLAFYGCEELNTVVLPDSVTRVGAYAFAECTGLTVLDLGSGVQTVEEAAFSDCYALRILDLPEKLRTIGPKGFYRCESITALTVPQNVSSVGTSAFGYCKRLVTAEILAQITVIPEFMFYGCGNLVSVILPQQISVVNDHSFRGCDQLCEIYYDGQTQTLEELREAVSQAVVSNDTPASVVKAADAVLNDDGTVTQEDITVIKGENVSVSATVEHTRTEGAATGEINSAELHVTVNGEQAWKEATALMQEGLSALKSRLEVDGESTEVDIRVYVNDTKAVDKKFVESVAGENVELEIVTSAGSGWKMDMTQAEKGAMSGKYDLSYRLTPAPQKVKDALGTPHVVQVKFNANAHVNAEVLIDLGQAWARQDAVLFQQMGGLNRCQTAVVDANGRAHFYLSAVSAKTKYYIAREVPAPTQEQAVAEVQQAAIPAELHEEYGITDSFRKTEYVITGRKSDWGMNIGQVTWIMVGIMATVVIAVGVTMYLLNKRKLKMGYIPELDE